jgi:cytidylate kinase
MVIAIGRQHGSAGREIARELAAEYGIKCYDKEIVDEAANSSTISRELFNSFDEKRVSPFMMQSTQFPGMSHGMGLNIYVASAQFDAIRSIADQHDCVFVGRCADYILRAVLSLPCQREGDREAVVGFTLVLRGVNPPVSLEADSPL